MVTEEKLNSAIKLEFDHGLDETGRPILKTKSFSNVRPEASNEKVYAVANTLSNLQQHGLKSITKKDATILAEA